jgi:hypothetical protein
MPADRSNPLSRYRRSLAVSPRVADASDGGLMQQLTSAPESTQATARALKISPKTVETHRGQLMQRLGIRDVAGLLPYALRTGLIAPGD